MLSDTPHQPAYARVLALPELLESILSFLKVSKTVPCALVSRYWNSIASRLIWRVLKPPPRALFRILGTLESEKLAFTNNSALRYDAWGRFASMASLVRELRVQIEDRATTTALDAQLLPRVNVLAQANNTTVFPALTNLTVLVESEGGVASAMTIINPPLTTLALTLSPKRVDCHSFVSIFARLQVCDKLKELRMEFNMLSEESHLIESTLSKSAASFHCLERLWLPAAFAFAPGAWDTIHSLKSIKKLVCTHQGRYGRNNPIHFYRPSFIEGGPNLLTFEATAPIPIVLSLFKDSASKQLRNLTLVVKSSASDLDNWSELIDLLVTKIPVPKRVVIKSHCLSSVSLRNPSLHAWKSLRYLIIETWNSASLTDDDYAALTLSMPHLTKLRISPYPIRSMGAPACTLKAVSYIAENCCNLEHLAICVDVSEEGDLLQPTQYSVFSTTLDEIDFGLTDIEEHPLTVASLIAWMTKDAYADITGGMPLSKNEADLLTREQNRRRQSIGDQWEDLQIQLEYLCGFVRSVEEALVPESSNKEDGSDTGMDTGSDTGSDTASETESRTSQSSM